MVYRLLLATAGKINASMSSRVLMKEHSSELAGAQGTIRAAILQRRGSNCNHAGGAKGPAVLASGPFV
jgi:hypothetical protein